MSEREKFSQFQHIIWDFYNSCARTMPWRTPESDGNFDPYKILVSELMLQQTQVDRVTPKYCKFLERFPSIEHLAGAELQEVLFMWSGLGYNRRAKYLHDIAKSLINRSFPREREELSQYKGLGHNTAAAILVYSFNQPLVFIETNIRTVYLHHFFRDASDVNDKQILDLVEKTIDKSNPREFYWGLMDYGNYLKKNGQQNITRSKHYKKQSTFEGSMRQLRGEVIRILTNSEKEISLEHLGSLVVDTRLGIVIKQLSSEGMVVQTGTMVHIP